MASPIVPRPMKPIGYAASVIDAAPREAAILIT
jgi:hypothetical protein